MFSKNLIAEELGIFNTLITPVGVITMHTHLLGNRG
jgi:hypothetical protein